MKVKTIILSLLLILFSINLFAQAPFVYDKENTGARFPLPLLTTIDQLPVIDPLPDPFMWTDGKGRSAKFSDWEHHRNDFKAQIEKYEIGIKPNRPENITASFSNVDSTLSVVVTVNGKSLTLTSKIILPGGKGPFPAVIGMNSPNGSIPADIFSSRNIARIRYVHNQVTTYNAPKNTDPYYQLYPEQWGASGQYSAWAWGVSRIIDGLELVQASLPIDLKHIAVTGCSYAGKMALFSGAFDERIALTMAQESGGGGATAWRVSETIGDVEKIGATSHQWFRESMFQFSGLEVSRLPIDHHELMAMVAPRALLVTGNTDYTWLANPACYVASRATKEIYRALGVSDRFGFYIDGSHNHCAIPVNQRPAIEAFVDKFLLERKEVNTDTVTIHPYKELDYKKWYAWWGKGKPVFVNEGSPVKIGLEAECGIIGSNWHISTDATGVKYVVSDSASTRNAPKDTLSNEVVIPFTIPHNGNYNFLAKVYVSDGGHQSFWVKVDQQPFFRASSFAGKGWQWGRLTSGPLKEGNHSVAISFREAGAKMDKLLVTNSSSSAVVNSEMEGSNCKSKQ
jgi:hypothetical protein